MAKFEYLAWKNCVKSKYVAYAEWNIEQGNFFFGKLQFLLEIAKYDGKVNESSKNAQEILLIWQLRKIKIKLI